MQSAAIFNPITALTPSQRLAIAARLAFRKKISDGAKPNDEVRCTSASVRAEQAPTIEKRMLPEPTVVEMAVGYIPDPWIPTDNHPRLDIRMIQIRVCNHYGVTRADLTSQRRTRDVVRPRQVAMYLAKKLTDKSLPQIGRAFGGRDHTTALHAVRTIDRIVKQDAEFAAGVAEVEAYLEALDS